MKTQWISPELQRELELARKEQQEKTRAIVLGKIDETGRMR